jgi:hypothetical protein
MIYVFVKNIIVNIATKYLILNHLPFYLRKKILEIIKKCYYSSSLLHLISFNFIFWIRLELPNQMSVGKTEEDEKMYKIYNIA